MKKGEPVKWNLGNGDTRPAVIISDIDDHFYKIVTLKCSKPGTFNVNAGMLSVCSWEDVVAWDEPVEDKPLWVQKQEQTALDLEAHASLRDFDSGFFWAWKHVLLCILRDGIELRELAQGIDGMVVYLDGSAETLASADGVVDLAADVSEIGGFSFPLSIAKGVCGHCWHPETQGDDCPMCAAIVKAEQQEGKIAQLEECIASQAIKLIEGAVDMPKPEFPPNTTDGGEPVKDGPACESSRAWNAWGKFWQGPGFNASSKSLRLARHAFFASWDARCAAGHDHG